MCYEACRYYLLGDVPDVTGHVQSHQPIVDRHLVERGSFLVAEECVGCPDLLETLLAKSDLKNCFENIDLIRKSY